VGTGFPRKIMLKQGDAEQKKVTRPGGQPGGSGTTRGG
jgi:hypothetical protein